MTINPALFSSKHPAWKTPRKFFEHYRARYNIQLDSCATPGDNLVDRYFAPPDPNWVLPDGCKPPLACNGLTTSWQEYVIPGTSVWCNPPYGREVGQWVEKAARESTNGFNVICLLPSRTDVKWFHRFVLPVLKGVSPGKVEFVSGRLKFEKPGVIKPDPAPFPSLVVIFGEIKESYYAAPKP